MALLFSRGTEGRTESYTAGFCFNEKCKEKKIEQLLIVKDQINLIYFLPFFPTF